MKAQVNLETTIEPHDLVYYLGLEPALHGRKAKVLPLDHRCLLQGVIRKKNIHFFRSLNLNETCQFDSFKF